MNIPSVEIFANKVAANWATTSWAVASRAAAEWATAARPVASRAAASQTAFDYTNGHRLL